MAVITTDVSVKQNIAPNSSKNIFYTFASWNAGILLSFNAVSVYTFIPFYFTPSSGGGGVTLQPVFRGKLGSNYVYSVGTPPGGGAVDIAIVGERE
jgi:hypothetical protein